MDQSNLNMRWHRLIDIVKDYDYEIFYHHGKTNVVANALSKKAANTSIGILCMRISIDSPLLELISEVQAEGSRRKIGSGKGLGNRLTGYYRQSWTSNLVWSGFGSRFWWRQVDHDKGGT